MTEPNVRPATPADLPGLIESSAGLFAADAGTHDPLMNLDWPRTDGAKLFPNTIADPNRLVLIAELNGKIIGHLTGMLKEPAAIRPIRLAELGSLFVFPEHRNLGLGTIFVERFVAWAKEKGADRLEVHAFAANSDAIRFYQRNGFTPYTLVLERDS